MMFYTTILIVFLPVLVSSENSKLELIGKVYEQCQKEASPLQCLKVQVLKVINRANLLSSIKINENFELVKIGNYSRSFTNLPDYEKNFEKLQSRQADEVLVEMIDQFLSTHRLQINTSKFIEEGRGSKMKKYIGPMIAALGIKGAFLALGYKGVAVLAGAALLVGKMAIVLATIIGLKMLLHRDDKTVVEIVKHPHYSHKHTHSSSHDDHTANHFYKNLNSNEEMMMEDKTYKASLPYPYYKL